ncbi:MAG: Brp/Blh family beta-carotene 15,15'-dioxygenase [Ferruginibacter sp.]
MIRIVLLIIGSVLLFFQQYFISISTDSQFIIFLTGILLLGVPHGAADLLVASRNAAVGKKSFSKFRFLAIYIFRLFLFAAILCFFPVTGNLLFIFFAAYHFGETDLHQFKTNTVLGKLFVISYGLVILSVILLPHFEEVKPIFQLFEAGIKNKILINWIAINRYYILSAAAFLFFTTTFIYFLKNGNNNTNEKGQFLIRFAIILIIVFYLPMLLGFTFYFVVWHSVISLNNIVLYLRNHNTYPMNVIVKQILLYSVLAITGIGLFGLTGFMFISSNAVAGYIFLGLAVLTAPHMQIMHDMYNSIRVHQHALS